MHARCTQILQRAPATGIRNEYQHSMAIRIQPGLYKNTNHRQLSCRLLFSGFVLNCSGDLLPALLQLIL